MADIGLLKTFVRASVEILRFVQDGATTAAAAASGSLASEGLSSSSGAARTNGSKHSAQNLVAAVPKLPSASGKDPALSAAADEGALSMWPATGDSQLGLMYGAFYCPAGLRVWSPALLQAHISILWVLQLRFQCGLRGIKPSRILGHSVLDYLTDLSAVDDGLDRKVSRTAIGSWTGC